MPILVLEDIEPLPKNEKAAPSQRAAADPDQRATNEKNELPPPEDGN